MTKILIILSMIFFCVLFLFVALIVERPIRPYNVRVIVGENQGRIGNVVSYSYCGLRLCVNTPANNIEVKKIVNDAIKRDYGGTREGAANYYSNARAWIHVWRWEIVNVK